jgi:transposase
MWKYLLGLELTDPGFHFSVLSEFRDRLVTGEGIERLLDTLLIRCRALGLLKARGQQRTDATHVLAAIRVLNRLELLGETLRAALNDLATVAPDWLQRIAPLAWYERYSKRIEDTRLPKAEGAREAYAQQVGTDGFALLEALAAPATAQELGGRASVRTLRQVWSQHFERLPSTLPPPEGRAAGLVRVKPPRELPRAAKNLESPYDVEARYSQKRGTPWTGYTVHLSETCDPTEVHLITQVHTTPATVHEAQCTAPMQQALVDKELAPATHFVDAAYVDAALLISSRQEHTIDLMGPTRPNVSWQAHVEGAYRLEQFTIDWEHTQVICPQGKIASTWTPQVADNGSPKISVKFRRQDCGACAERARCTRAKTMPRHLYLHPREQYEALEAARTRFNSDTGQVLYKRRAGIEGTLSQGVRAFGLRRTRYRGMSKTHLQHVATAAAINLERLVAWFDARPRAQTRTSRFAALTPSGGFPL